LGFCPWALAVSLVAAPFERLPDEWSGRRQYAPDREVEIRHLAPERVRKKLKPAMKLSLIFALGRGNVAARARTAGTRI
jgi:hypothetical protein